MSLTRRNMLFGGTALAALGAAALWMRGAPATRAAEGPFEIEKTEAEWRAILDDFEYAVLREEATERAFTSPLNDEKRAGTFVCKGCDLPLFSSETKYDSGTGWPSFWTPINDTAIGESTDYKLGYARTEVHCSRCGRRRPACATASMACR